MADITEDFDFKGASKDLEALLPAGMSIREVFRDDLGDATKAMFLSDLNDAPLLVNYLGHGSQTVWRGLFNTPDEAQALTNGLNSNGLYVSRLPFFVMMSCLIGYFQDVYSDCIAEALLKAEGGAVAVWASSGLTQPDGQIPMNKALIQLLFGGEGLTIGEATMKAKAATTDQDIRRTWILFADPTIKLK